MHTKGFVYIRKATPERPIIGCGAYVIGGLIATCRHVWHDAAAIADTPTEQVEIDFPGASLPQPIIATLADLCNPLDERDLDLALLKPSHVPPGREPYFLSDSDHETGAACAYAGLRRSNRQIEVQIGGEIATAMLMTESLRPFTGSNQSGYWFETGSSGSPIFRDGGLQLAGLISLSEVGGNTGKNHLHEAFVIPGSVINTHIARHRAQPTADRTGIDPEKLAPILESLGAQNTPESEIRKFLTDAIENLRAQAATPPPKTHDGPETDGTIARARARLQEPDLAGARAILDEAIETQTRALLRVLKERVAIDRAAFDHAAAITGLIRITALDPDDVWAWIDLGTEHVTVGSLHQALAAHRNAETAAQRTGDERDLSVSYDNIGNVLVAQGNLPDALTSYRDSLAIRERLAKSDPGNTEWQRDLSVSYDNIGNVLVAQGNLPDALTSYRDSLAIADRLAKSDPGNTQWQRDLSVSYEKIGNVLVAQGTLPDALTSYRDSLAIRERLAKSDPGNTEWQRDLSVSYEKIGNVLVAQGNLPDALTSYRDSLAICDRLAKSDPGNTEWQRDLSVSYEKIGEVLVAQGTLPDALTSYRDGLAIVERLAKSDPGNTEWQRDLSVSYNKIGDVLVAQGNLPDALTSYHDGLAIAERLAKSDPGNTQWQRDLALSHGRIADALRRTGDTPGARDAFRQAQSIFRRLTALSPDNAIWKNDLAYYTTQLAALPEN